MSIDAKRLALVLAIQAEIDGMNAENLQRTVCGESMAYTYEDFQSKSEELRNVGYAHEDQL